MKPREEPTHARADVLLGLIGVQVFFGLHYVAAKAVLVEMAPQAWALVRVTGAAVLLLSACVAGRRRFPRDARSYLHLAGFSIFGVVVNQISFVEGLARTTPTHSSLLNTTVPVITLGIAVLLGRERVRVVGLAALIVAWAGVLLVLRPWASDLSAEFLRGDALTLANAASFSLFLVISKPLLSRIDALVATAVLLAFGALGIAVFGAADLIAVDPGLLSTRFWWLAAFIIALPTAAAYLINSWALSKVDSSLVAFFIFLQPALAAGVSWLLLGERFEPRDAWGAVLILGAVVLATRRPRAR